MGGGRLSKDLTAVISRMPAPGVQAILSSPPFPVMQQAYLGHPLTDDEIFALTAFFQKLDSDRVAEAPSRHGLGLFFIGVVGAALLMVLYAMIWMRRKQERVYLRSTPAAEVVTRMGFPVPDDARRPTARREDHELDPGHHLAARPANGKSSTATASSTTRWCAAPTA